MKLSHTTLLAILATSTFVSAAPTIQLLSETSMVKRADVKDVLSLIDELENLKQKRSITGDELDIAELDKRADSVIGELISALASSGIIGDVWDTLTTDANVQSEIKTVVQASLKGALVYGPSLLEALYKSGLFGEIFTTVLNDSDLKTALLDAAKSIFSFAFDLIKGGSGSSSPSYGGSASTTAALGGTTTTTQVSTSTTVVKRDDLSPEYLSERDLSAIVTTVVDTIKNSGIVSSLINKVLANPQKSISFLTTVFQKGLVVGEEVYKLAKSSGLLSKMISYLESSGSTYISAIGNVLGKFLGDLNSTSTSTSNYSSSKGTTIETTAVAATNTPAYSAAGSDNDQYSIAQAAIAAMGTSTPTTLVRRAY